MVNYKTRSFDSLFILEFPEGLKYLHWAFHIVLRSIYGFEGGGVIYLMGEGGRGGGHTRGGGGRGGGKQKKQ